jgi:hypothetical protein
MKHILQLEHIGADVDARCRSAGALVGAWPGRRPWVAEIAGASGRFWFDRKFVEAKTDYSTANGVGSRGVLLTYLVEDGHVYEIKRWDSWRSSRRYFARWEDGLEIEMSKDEVEKWVSSVRSAKTY